MSATPQNHTVPSSSAVPASKHAPASQRGGGDPHFDAGLEAIELLGMRLASCSEVQLLDALFGALAQQRGGWLITANLDFLRRYYKDQRMQVLYSEADLRVADGMPLVWAARLQGTPLPERIAGSSLIRPLARRASIEGRRIYFLGGDAGTAEAGGGRNTRHRSAFSGRVWSCSQLLARGWLM